MATNGGIHITNEPIQKQDKLIQNLVQDLGQVEEYE